MATSPWNERYASGDLPWDVGEPDEHLIELVGSGRVRPGRAIEIGCGTGTNALWLAEHGFAVEGVDVSTIAIASARAKLGDRTLTCRFLTEDFMTAERPEGGHGFAFDRGCFHTLHEAAPRATFAARVAAALDPGGFWLSLIGSTEGAPRDTGPPRRSAREVVEAIEPVLEIVELRSVMFHSRLDPVPAWFCLARRRSAPAQPSTLPR